MRPETDMTPPPAITHRLINVCLVPATSHYGIAQSFVSYAQNIAFWADQKKTAFYLAGAPRADDAIYSAPHVTLAHLRVDTAHEGEMNDLSASLAAIRSPGLTLSLPDVSMMPGLPPFNRNGHLGLGADLIQNETHALFARVQSTEALRQLQTTVIEAARRTLPQTDILTATGDTYVPHVTLAAQDSATGELTTPPWNQMRAFRDVPFVLSIGDVGPQGQVRRCIDPKTHLRAIAPAPTQG